MSPSASTRGPWSYVLAGGVGLLLIFVVAGTWLYVRGGGPTPSWLGLSGYGTSGLLAASGPEEQVLRSLRLLGIDRAVVGEESGTAMVRIEVPDAGSPAGIALAWQGGLSTLKSAYPSAERYVVQIYGPGAQSLVELSWTGGSARGSSEPGALGRSASVRYLSKQGPGS